MRDFYVGFEKRANLLATGAKLLTRGASAVKGKVVGPNNVFTGRGTGVRGAVTRGAGRVGGTVARNPIKSGIGALTAADVVSQANKAAKGGAGRTFKAGPYT